MLQRQYLGIGPRFCVSQIRLASAGYHHETAKLLCPALSQGPKQVCPGQKSVPRNTISRRTCTLHCVGKNDGSSHWRYVRIVCQAAAAMWLDRQLCRFAGGRGMHSACCVSKGSVNSCRPDAAQRAANSASRAAHRCAEVSRVFRGFPARKVMMCHP